MNEELNTLKEQVEKLQSTVDSMRIENDGLKRIIDTETQFIDGRNIQTGKTIGTQIGTESDQMLGFFGTTPVVQPSGTGETSGFTAGAGTGVNDDSTFTGNVGATAYRVNDIVKALKNTGIINT